MTEATEKPFTPADPARFNNPDLMTHARARRFAQALADRGCPPAEVRRILDAYGWTTEPVFDVIDGGREMRHG